MVTHHISISVEVELEACYSIFFKLCKICESEAVLALHVESWKMKVSTIKALCSCSTSWKSFSKASKALDLAQRPGASSRLVAPTFCLQ